MEQLKLKTSSYTCKQAFADLGLTLLFVSILATALVTPLQVASQRYTTTTRVGIILLLEPVTAAILAFFFLHEILGLAGIIGCLFILSGLLLGEWKRV
ncbi:MAG: DMT family transporter [Syntrophomonas sp.]|nr:DMT family transporter [Syntrophomonas sp.]